jgi:hypothetical protein
MVDTKWRRKVGIPSLLSIELLKLPFSRASAEDAIFTANRATTTTSRRNEE